jgi:hypothetical protein
MDMVIMSMTLLRKLRQPAIAFNVIVVLEEESIPFVSTDLEIILSY